ncbi:MAG: hypothetical protein HY961_14630 [Ignavibacteriae bacterium]|nr:hypothetical protein [Ignavibacteriota bacterium]
MKFTRLILVAVTLLMSQNLFAHEGEEHGDAAQKPAPQSGTGEGVLTLAAVTENFEVVIKYPPTEPGEELKLLIYLSDYATNKPIKDAEIAFELKGLEGVTPQVGKTDLAGVYHAEVTLPDTMPHDVLLTITTKDIVDLIPLSGIQAGKALPGSEPAEHAENEGLGLGGMLLLFVGMLLLLAGFGYAVYRIAKRRAMRQPHAASHQHLESTGRMLRRSA